MSPGLWRIATTAAHSQFAGFIRVIRGYEVVTFRRTLHLKG